MNEITCDMCMDLIPLVQDGIASEDSRQAVEHHVHSCRSCRSLYSGQEQPPVDGMHIWKKFQRKLRFSMAMIMVLGIFFGLGLTASSEMFYNSVVMPVIGVLGYVVFRWKAFYMVPLLLLFANGLSHLVGVMLGTNELDILSRLMWTIIYSIFVWVGIVIAGLMHFAFRKE